MEIPIAKIYIKSFLHVAYSNKPGSVQMTEMTPLESSRAMCLF